jgi:hypothetical protein
MVQLSEEEGTNFAQLKVFEPKEFRLKGVRHKVELRSLPIEMGKASLAREAKQTVMPGSIYILKSDAKSYDISVWYHNGAHVAHSVADIALTTPHQDSVQRHHQGHRIRERRSTCLSRNGWKGTGSS